MEERKKRILLAVTTDYIATAEPVGSRTIVKHYSLGVSPATVRNEMADLEDNGYLVQPHTSAGRVPSDKGYRFYVDVLMDGYELTAEEKRAVAERLVKKQRDMESLVVDTARLLAELCHNAAVMLGPMMSSSEFRHVDLVPMSEGRVFVVLVASPGLVKSQVLTLESELGESEIKQIENYLNDHLKGVSLMDLDTEAIDALQTRMVQEISLVHDLPRFLKDALAFDQDLRLYTEGASYMLEQPEFRDSDRIGSLLRVLETGQHIRALLSERSRLTRGVDVHIGTENELDSLRDCSIVRAVYNCNGRPAGSFAVIGPTRMDYARVSSVIRHMARALSDTLSGM